MTSPLSVVRGAASRFATRRYLASRLPSSSLFDQEFYEAQVGTTFRSERAALRDFLSRSSTESLSPNPLFEAHWYAGSWTQATSRHLRNYLRSGPGKHGVGPLFDADGYIRQNPGAAAHPGGSLGHFLEHATRETALPLPAGVRGPMPAWGDLRQALLASARRYGQLTSRQAQDEQRPPHRDPEQLAAHHAAWQSLGARLADWPAVEAALGSRVPGRVSISMPTHRDWRMTARAVDAVLLHSGDHDVEIVVVENGSGRSFFAILDALFVAEPRVRIEPVPHNLNFALGSNLGMVRSTGGTIVFLNNDTEVLDGWLEPLLAALEMPGVRGVQPLLLYPDGTIQSAGCMFTADGLPAVTVLGGLPPEDARRAGQLSVPAATAAALAVRAEEFAALQGFDPAYVNGQEDVDYALRATERSGGHFVVETSSTVVHHEKKSPGRMRRAQQNRAYFVERWGGSIRADAEEVLGPTGLSAGELRWPDVSFDGEITVPEPRYVRPARTVEEGPAEGAPSLRWALKLAAHPGPRGDGWGDVHYAASLTTALERLGQEVVIDRREAYGRDFRHLDDVTLVLRGLEQVPAQDDAVNLLWVISHPDLVTDVELGTYDRILGASVAWSAAVSDRGYPAEPLLQATDPSRFHPDLADATHSSGVLFVGRSRNVLRPIVRDAQEAGVDLVVYGDGWEQFGLGDHVVAQYLPYDEVGRAYASAGVVLNDHWADMARDGFLSNRLFDAVATGARVVSDEVAGLDELFRGCVQVYRSVEDLRELCSPEGRDRFPDDAARREVASLVAQEHSFDVRARRLLDLALDVRAARGA